MAASFRVLIRLPDPATAKVFFPPTCSPELGTLIHYLTDISVLITFLDNLFYVFLKKNLLIPYI